MKATIALCGFVLALQACGGGGSLPPPNAPQIPAGSGWMCFSAYAPIGCSRTLDECQKNEGEYAKSIGGGPVNECKTHPEVYCYTAKDRGAPMFRCYPSQDSCESRRDPVRNLSGMSDVSACAVFR